MSQVSRRSLLAAGAATGTLGAVALGSTDPADARVWRAASRALHTAGTTLQQAAVPHGASGYRRLTAGPGYPLVVRQDIVAGSATRDSRRTALASFVQFTDLHVIDAQSPVRFEYLHQQIGSAFRPQEALGTQGAARLVARVNTLRTGPFTGRAFDCVVSTGDNTDNHETIELDWYLRVLSGGGITANTGDPHRWEGAQTTGNTLYYNPELAVRDMYKKVGFPLLPGFFARAIAEHTSPGLKTPWYAVFGNHDDSIQGTLPSTMPPFAEMYTGNIKFTGFATAAADQALVAARTTGSPRILSQSRATKAPWIVTADARRAAFTPRQFMQAHRAPAVTGPGPVGHGFSQSAIDANVGYYTFAIAPGVTGISMDSTNRAGFTDGSIGTAQLDWIIATLTAGSRRYYDTDGHLVTHAADDRLFVLFSHHTSTSMGNTIPDPGAILEKRHTGDELVSTLQRFPNLIAWVNGHTHKNQITAQRGSTAAQSFWEINTASHIDFPQHARIIDVCDNKDGTLSLFTTLIESDAPYQASGSAGDQKSLASMYRELSFNDLGYDATRLGGAGDHNTELLVPNPLR